MLNTNTPVFPDDGDANGGHKLDPALKMLIDEHLVPAAIKAVGNKRDEADLKPESIVASVIAEEIPKAPGRCNDESHLRARLITAVKNKVIDRLRKRDVIDRFNTNKAHEGFSASGPGTQVANAESLAQAAESFKTFREILLALAKNTEERILLDEYVLAGKEWAQVASSAGLTAVAAKKHLSRRRSSLLEELCRPLRGQLDGESWAVAEGLIVERQSPTAVAETLGMTEHAVKTIFASRIIPEFKSLYGKNAYEGLLRLMGNKHLSKS